MDYFVGVFGFPYCTKKRSGGCPRSSVTYGNEKDNCYDYRLFPASFTLMEVSISTPASVSALLLKCKEYEKNGKTASTRAWMGFTSTGQEKLARTCHERACVYGVVYGKEPEDGYHIVVAVCAFFSYCSQIDANCTDEHAAPVAVCGGIGVASCGSGKESKAGVGPAGVLLTSKDTSVKRKAYQAGKVRTW